MYSLTPPATTNLYKQIFTNCLEAIIISNLAGDCLEQNNAHRQLIGYSDEELVNQNIIANYLTPTVFEKIRTQLHREGSCQGVFQIITKEKELKIVDLRSSVFYDTMGKPSLYIFMVKDITEKVSQEQKQQNIEHKYKHLVDCKPTIYITVNREKEIIEISDFGANYLGYSRDDLLNQSFSDLLVENEALTFQQYFNKCLANPNQSKIWETQRKKKDGQIIWVKEHIRCVILDGVKQLFIVWEDITSRVLADQSITKRLAFKQLIADLSTKFINVPLKDINHEVEKSLAKIGDFWNVDRAIIFSYNKEKENLSINNQWQKATIAPLKNCHEDLQFNKQDELYNYIKTNNYKYIHQPSAVLTNPSNPNIISCLINKINLYSAILLGLWKENQIIGYMVLANIRKDSIQQETQPFSKELGQKFKIVSRIFSNVLLRQQSLQQINDRLSIGSVLSNITSMLADVNASNIDTQVPIFLRDLCTVLHVDGSCIFIQNKESHELKVAYHWHKNEEQEKSNNHKAYFEELGKVQPLVDSYLERGYFFIPNLNMMSGLKTKDKNLLKKLRANTICSFGSSLNDKYRGFFVMTSANPTAKLTDDVLPTLKVVGQILSDIITNYQVKQKLLLTQFTQDNAPNPIYWFLPDGSVFYSNNAACKFLDYKKEELHHKHIYDIDSEYGSQDWQSIWNFIKEKRYLKRLTKHQTKQGKLIPVEIEVKYLNYENKEYMCAFVTDVSERILAIEKQKMYQDFLRTIIDTSPNLIFVKDTAGRYVLVNEALSKVFNTSTNQLIGKKINELIKEYTISYEISKQDQLVLENKTSCLVVEEQIPVLKTGEKKWFQTIKVPIMSIDGKKQHMLGVSTDITERKVAEQKIAKKHKELQILAESLKQSNNELQHFAYAASHDLQEPLRMISLFLQLLEKRYGSQLDENAKEYIGFAVDGAKRMSKLIKDLLEYSRVATRTKTLVNKDLESVLAITQQNLKVKIKETNTTINIGSLPTLPIDISQLSRVFQNLIGNAIKFRQPNTSPIITIEALELEHDWQIIVADNGIGIEKEFHETVFTIFKRLHSREEYEGTGIGLAICKRIIARHNGKIWLESTVGKGTTFYITLPKVAISTTPKILTASV